MTGPDAIAAAMFGLAVSSLPFSIMAALATRRAQQAVPGSRQRYVLVTLVRFGTFVGLVGAGAGIVRHTIDRDWLLLSLGVFNFVLGSYNWVMLRRRFDGDDDFWNDLGRGVKRLLRPRPVTAGKKASGHARQEEHELAG